MNTLLLKLDESFEFTKILEINEKIEAKEETIPIRRGVKWK